MEAMCDPCLIRDKETNQICGWQGRSLSSHLKSHKKTKAKNSPSWKLAEYKKKFPTANIGEPTFTPGGDYFAKLAEKKIAEAQAIAVETGPTKSEEEIVAERFEALWEMCELDPAAKVFCMAVAEDQVILENAYKRLKMLTREQQQWDQLKGVNVLLDATSERLDRNMKSLNLTVAQRKASNTLGNDTVSQLICNYANTLRKQSAEKREAFMRRVGTVDADIKRRVKMKHLDEIVLNEKQNAERIENDDDYRSRINSFGAKID